MRENLHLQQLADIFFINGIWLTAVGRWQDPPKRPPNDQQQQGLHVGELAPTEHQGEGGSPYGTERGKRRHRAAGNQCSDEAGTLRGKERKR